MLLSSGVISLSGSTTYDTTGHDRDTDVITLINTIHCHHLVAEPD
jgi:hypothetical protein